MVNCLNEAVIQEIKCRDSEADRNGARSFKKIREIRRRNRLHRHLGKSLSRKKTASRKSLLQKPSSGPTKETIARLRPDPLVRLKNMNILNDEQIQAFRRIRRAVQTITDGTQVRIACFNDVVVQTSRHGHQPESEYEIKIKDHYSHWIDRMTIAGFQAGPVLDIIIDEMSLMAVDRKWGHRKGWAKDRLQASLNLYWALPSSGDRNG
ncbi:MAG: hypothetical protein COB49_06700 [Alphaproteobacteria bacterium]|nr:MAG: hypothetical protein COB49_06700 [Alphaproteobacteria bacterium]